jgi:hypothetical protein
MPNINERFRKLVTFNEAIELLQWENAESLAETWRVGCEIPAPGNGSV